MDNETNSNEVGLNSIMSPIMNSSQQVSNHCKDINEEYYGIDYLTLAGVQAAFGFFYVFIFILGFIGNTSVIIKVATNRKLQSARNIFLLNLMLSDVLLCFTSVPVTPISHMIKRWIFGEILCSLISMCQAMSVTITSFSLAAIAVDKFIHIIDCTKAPITLWQAFSVVVLIWLFAILVNVPMVLSFKLIDGSEYLDLPDFKVAFCGQFCVEKRWEYVSKPTYGTIIMCVQFIIPMVIISFCYSRILSKVAKDMMIQNKQFSSSLSEVQRTDALQKRRRVNYILITMVAAFIASWFPLTLYNILSDYGQVSSFISEQPYLWPLVGHGIAMSTVVWNPLLFFWMTRSRRAQRRGLLHSFLVTSSLTWNPFSSVFRKRRRSAFAGSDSSSRLNGIHKNSRISTNGSLSDFDSYARVETTDSEPLKKVSRSSLYANGTSINSMSPKRPISLPGIVTDNNSKRLKNEICPVQVPAGPAEMSKNSKLKQIIYVKLGNSVHV